VLSRMQGAPAESERITIYLAHAVMNESYRSAENHIFPSQN